MVKFLIEGANVFSFDEVNECIANIALVVLVNGKIKEIKFILMIDGKLGEEGILGVLVGDIFDHDGGSTIFLNLIKINDESFALFHRN